jgi:hypothetical protein
MAARSSPKRLRNVAKPLAATGKAGDFYDLVKDKQAPVLRALAEAERVTRPVPDPMLLDDGHLSAVFERVVKALSGLSFGEYADAGLFVYQGTLFHVTQRLEGRVFCHHCNSGECPALYVLAKEGRF